MASNVQTQSLLLRMRIFSDERKVKQRISEILIGHGGVGEHAGAGMAFPDGVRPFLVGFQAQDIRIPQIGGRGIQLRYECGSVRFQPGDLADIPINPMTVVTDPFPIEDLPTSKDIALQLPAWLRDRRFGPGLCVRRGYRRNPQPTHEQNSKNN